MKQTLVSDSLEVIIHHFGAEVCSVKNKKGVEFIWQGKPEIWPRHAPVLFPVVGKLKNNAYRHQNTHYELSQHGFARDKPFELVSSDKESCTFRLVTDKTAQKNYPFDFILDISYHLAENKLTTTYHVTNPSEKQLLFSIGAHPGFNCPLTQEERFEDYYLLFERPDLIRSSLNNGLRTENKEQMQLNNNRLPLHSRLFDDDALVFENKQIQQVSLCSTKSEHKITINCNNWPYFGVWSKKACSEFICLEPWYGIADAENSDQVLLKKEGIHALEKQEVFTCSFSISFH